MTGPSDDALINRTFWRLMPLAALCFVVGVIDKSNIGFAKLEMTHDLAMSEAVFGFGASLFFLAFMLCELPSALLGHRFGARAWIARIMATWGLTTVLLAFTASVPEFYGLRFALGVAEAGLYPTLLYYLTLWFPQAQQARVSGFLLLGSAFGNGGGALISGALLGMNGTFGLAGWQWIFLVTGALPLLTTALVLRFLPDRPEHARFLSAQERARLAALVEADKPRGRDERHVLAALADLRVLGFSFVYALLGIALFGMIYWTPTAIRGFGVSGAVNGALTGAPWAITALLLVTVPARLKTRKAVLTSLTATGLVGALAFAIAALYRAPELRYTALVVGTPCISLSIAVFWALPVRLFAGVHAAAAIAAINVFGNLGGFIAQNLMPAAAKAGGGPGAAMWVPSLCLLAIGLGAMVVRGRRATPQLSSPARRSS